MRELFLQFHFFLMSFLEFHIIVIFEFCDLQQTMLPSLVTQREVSFGGGDGERSTQGQVQELCLLVPSWACSCFLSFSSVSTHSLVLRRCYTDVSFVLMCSLGFKEVEMLFIHYRKHYTVCVFEQL